MTKQNISDAIGAISNRHIEEAADFRLKNKRPLWIKAGALAACLCLIIIGAAAALSRKPAGKPVLHWTADFPAASYFKYNSDADNSSTSSMVDRPITYATERDFSDARATLEAEGIIPAMPDYPLFSCIVCYNADDSIFSINLSWHRRGDFYSDLSVTLGREEIEQIQDCIFIELDEDGNIVPPAVTVTERDGIQIVAEGNENRDKTMTFQTDTAWYQIAGSWNDSYEAVVALFDWVWTHPIDFERFTIEQGAEITHTTFAEYPDAFADALPDFDSFGYIPGQYYLRLKDGKPLDFEGHYFTGVDAALLEDGSYLAADGWTEIHWCINTAPDYYDLQECNGDPRELSEQQVKDIIAAEQRISFLYNGYYIRVYCKDADAVWKAICALP